MIHGIKFRRQRAARSIRPIHNLGDDVRSPLPQPSPGVVSRYTTTVSTPRSSALHAQPVVGPELVVGEPGLGVLQVAEEATRPRRSPSSASVPPGASGRATPTPAHPGRARGRKTPGRHRRRERRHSQPDRRSDSSWASCGPRGSRCSRRATPGHRRRGRPGRNRATEPSESRPTPLIVLNHCASSLSSLPTRKMGSSPRLTSAAADPRAAAARNHFAASAPSCSTPSPPRYAAPTKHIASGWSCFAAARNHRSASPLSGCTPIPRT